MKKGLKYLMLGALLFPVTVKADMGAPDMFDVEVVCNKTEGCQRYEYDYTSKKLKEAGMASYGDRGKAQYSYEEDGKEYYSVYFSNKEYYVVKGEFVSIKEKVEPTDKSITKLKQKVSAIVSNKDGAKMYSGPHEAFTTVTTIPQGTKLEYEYGFEDQQSGWGVTFFYTTYKGKSGWVSYESVAKEYKKAFKVKTYEEIKSNDVVIPVGTEIQVKYGTFDGNSQVLVNYEGKDIYVDTEKLAVEDGKNYTLNFDIELVKDVKGDEKVKKFKKGSQVTFNYVASITIDETASVDEYYIYVNDAGWYKYSLDYNKKNFLYDGQAEKPLYSYAFEFKELAEPSSDEPTTETTEPTTEVTTQSKDEPTSSKNGGVSPITLIVMFVGLAVLMAFVTIVCIVALKKKKPEEETNTNEQGK
jgi:uncharacterized protein YraI